VVRGGHVIPGFCGALVDILLGVDVLYVLHREVISNLRAICDQDRDGIISDG